MPIPTDSVHRFHNLLIINPVLTQIVLNPLPRKKYTHCKIEVNQQAYQFYNFYMAGLIRKQQILVDSRYLSKHLDQIWIYPVPSREYVLSSSNFSSSIIIHVPNLLKFSSELICPSNSIKTCLRVIDYNLSM